jgi:hypothetical protein
MKLSVKYCCSIIVLSCMLAACLPGEKQEQKVIAKAQQATQQVAAERVAADMSNAAQTLLAGSIPTNSNELQTIHCNDQKSVVAFIPRSSKIAKGGTLAEPLANRMRDQLQSQFTSKAVGGSDLVATCGGDVQNVAVNSPVLVLQGAFAEQGNAVSVQVTSCGDVNGMHVPGTIITKVMKDGTTVVENNCGKAIQPFANKVTDGNGSDVDISNINLPDWKARLTGASATATQNFKCVVHDGVSCDTITAQNAGLLTQCSSSQQTESYMSNPQYANGTWTSAPAVTNNCGPGWTGQKIARIRSQQCTITLQGQPQQPATVYDVAYVAAKCSKDNIMNVPTQCPASEGTFYAEYGHVDMLEPVVLEPQSSILDSNGNAVAAPSMVALPGTQTDPTVASQVKSLTNSAQLFVPTINLRNVTDPDAFSAALVKNMGSAAKLSSITGCNEYGNTCTGTLTVPPRHIVIVLDRSASMGSKNSSDMISIPSVLTQGFSCKAGLRNIFASAQADDACTAATAFQQKMPYQPPSNGIAPKVMDFVIHPWGSGTGPTDDATSALYTTMQNALTDQAKYTPYLQFALSTGWDCSGRATAGSTVKEIFPDDMFGTCSAAQSCNTCPGQCEETDIGTVPDGGTAQRVQAAQWVLEQLARLNLNKNIKITLASFLNDQPNVQTITYCPPEHQNSAGACDITLERQALINLFTRPGDVKEFVKPVSQEVTIPTEPLPAAAIYLVPDKRTPSGNIKEVNSDYKVPANNVITGRFHHGDYESGWTQYEYATLKAVDQNGKNVPGTITFGPVQRSDKIQESDQEGSKRVYKGVWFDAPSGYAIVGRTNLKSDDPHGNADENGYERYYTVAVTFTPTATGVPVPVQTVNIVKPAASLEESGQKDGQVPTWFTSGPTQIMTGRMHFGDENWNPDHHNLYLNTSYSEGSLSVPCTADLIENGLCQQPCDRSICAKLPAVTASGDWESWSDASAKGTVTKSGDYEYSDCAPYPKTCIPNGPGGPAPLNPVFDTHIITPAYAIAMPINGGGGCTIPPPPANAWKTSDDPTTATYCSMRRLRQDWVTAATAKANGTFDDSVKPAPAYQDNDDYQFQSCSTVEDCTKVQHDCDTGNASACSTATTCQATLTNQLNAVKDEWLTGAVGGDCTGTTCEDKVSTYCTERLKKPNASTDNEALAACLDVCGAHVVSNTDIRTCTTATNLFTGVTATNCAMVQMPSVVDYRSTTYNGKYVTQLLTRYVPSQEGEAGSVQVATGSTVWGADYGGNTPLYATIDAALKEADVKADMDAHTPMSFIVLTDGQDTGATATTTSFCNNNSDSFLNELAAVNPYAHATFISLNDFGVANLACNKRVPDDFVSQLKLLTVPSILSSKLVISGSVAATANSLKDAETFCLANYGSFYSDDKVVATTSTDGSAVSPPVCRAYEIQQ